MNCAPPSHNTKVLYNVFICCREENSWNYVIWKYINAIKFVGDNKKSVHVWARELINKICRKTTIWWWHTDQVEAVPGENLTINDILLMEKGMHEIYTWGHTTLLSDLKALTNIIKYRGLHVYSMNCHFVEYRVLNETRLTNKIWQGAPLFSYKNIFIKFWIQCIMSFLNKDVFIEQTML
jgi:hypothetical protein